MTPTLALAGEPLPLVGHARAYVCGITPYDTTHLGHASTFVWADVATRVLRRTGVSVEVCRNVTDVDDVLDAAAERAGSRFDSFAAVGQFRFDRDMAALGVRPPAHEPRAHNHVDDTVRLAAGLLARGVAYERDGEVLLRASAVGITDVPDDASSQVPPSARADDPADPTIWRPAQPGEAAWPSPWGDGRPGWHAECAAMALSVLGPSVDLHVGGADLRHPHHTGMAAMAEAMTGVRPFARARLHVGTVRVDGAKMAKSAGNLVLVSDLLESWPAAAVRLLVLDRPWAQAWDVSPDDVAAAADRLERLFSAAGRHVDGEAAADAVLAALLDDLDVPAALALAESEGGEAARLALSVLGLT
ncbi:class I tRNA ligase family protein [Actinomycetospora termitidis]|uniref:Cysteine--tRNA ligase n=1 Tax=Actinomycetospora termitidis TaxID=3053470 RepID=A0ABT7M908_9PSEU|nr:class I tRNA ligase family protein [Actinomycetospora sp. Odt1-22]MDL5156272.1 cysteine--tRNA ligase [Actinomycetospora sp. Odt1-22]